MAWDLVARALFCAAGAFSVWAIIHTTREALPYIWAIMEELNNDA